MTEDSVALEVQEGGNRNRREIETMDIITLQKDQTLRHRGKNTMVILSILIL